MILFSPPPNLPLGKGEGQIAPRIQHLISVCNELIGSWCDQDACAFLPLPLAKGEAGRG